MANRRRGTHSLPEELRTSARHSTKKEMAQYRRSLPRCPTPTINKVRRSFAGHVEKPKAIFFRKSVSLDSEYEPDSEMTYFAQMFSTYYLIGEGSFGKVFRACSSKDNQMYAIKRIKSCVNYTDRYSEIHNYEKICEHPNIVHYFMSWEENGELFMKLENCDVSLADFSFFYHEFPEKFLWDILYDMCKALYFLHCQHLIHLDVKPANIMMKNGFFKLADFGIMADLRKEPIVIKTVSDGDAKYLAPEVLEGIYKPACDMFGLGISLLELACDLELPCYGILWHQLRQEILPDIFYDKVSLGFTILVERMLKPQYEERPTAQKILKYSSVRAIEKRDKKEPRSDFYELVRNNLPEEDVMVLMEVVGLANNLIADAANHNNNENNNIICTPPCPPRHSFVDYPEYPSLFRYAVPGPCRPIGIGKALVFDEERKSPLPSKPRKLSKFNNRLVDFASIDSDNLFEMDSDDLDSEEQENCDVTMEQVSDYKSPVRMTRSKMPKTKLNFD